MKGENGKQPLMAAAGHNRQRPAQVLQRKEKQMEKKEMILEREFISIYEMNEEKHIEYHGYSYARPEPYNGKEYAICDVRSCEAPLKDVLKEGIWDWITNEAPECMQYGDDCTEEEIKDIVLSYFDGKPGTQLDFDTITMDTPYGDYWDELSE